MCFQICLEGIFNRTIAALQKKQKYLKYPMNPTYLVIHRIFNSPYTRTINNTVDTDMFKCNI